MGIVVKDKVFELPDEGVHTVTITEVQDLGLVETNFGTKDRVRIVLECQDQKDSEGNPIKLFITATKSLHPKSTLGNTLTQLQVPVGAEFDLEDLVGLTKSAVVQHNEGNNGKTYANIVSFLKK
jgi:hypothetical protein